MNWSFLPNFITVVRVVLLIPLAYYLTNEIYDIALVLFFIAGFSDALDGFLAKKFSWVSRFGAILDPLADKALLIITMFLLAMNGELSKLLLSIVILRDIFIVSGAYYFHHRLGPFEMAPTVLSKFNTFCQLLLVTSILLSSGLILLPDWFLISVEGVTYVLTISSGIHYGWVWGRKFKSALNAKHASSDDLKSD